MRQNVGKKRRDRVPDLPECRVHSPRERESVGERLEPGRFHSKSSRAVRAISVMPKPAKSELS